jgi:hypothetical protein
MNSTSKSEYNWIRNSASESIYKKMKKLKEGPGKYDTFFTIALGFNLCITKITYLTFDLMYSINLTSEISYLTGKPIKGVGNSGGNS